MSVATMQCRECGNEHEILGAYRGIPLIVCPQVTDVDAFIVGPAPELDLGEPA